MFARTVRTCACEDGGSVHEFLGGRAGLPRHDTRHLLSLDHRHLAIWVNQNNRSNSVFTSALRQRQHCRQDNSRDTIFGVFDEQSALSRILHGQATENDSEQTPFVYLLLLQPLRCLCYTQRKYSDTMKRSPPIPVHQVVSDRLGATHKEHRSAKDPRMYTNVARTAAHP